MTKFRPCIDLHQGQVKQIVGSTLIEESSTQSKEDAKLATNFSTTKPSSEFAQLYQKDALTGGHVIMLGPGNQEAAESALTTYPGQLQIGGGINETNCQEWLDKGASHVIITSAVFQNGQIDLDRLKKIVDLIGKDKLVLDLSCRRKPGEEDDHYYVVTDKWQKFTNYPVTAESLQTLAKYCDEFLVHGVDVEGKQCGILEDLVVLLGQHSPVPVTYAGGVRSVEDLDLVHRLGNGSVDVTVGSALDIFGGALPYDQVVQWHKEKNAA
jgi:phosphoribosylformimino-5-aminoimidazole carboxamide ribotide isomerase